MDLVVQGISAAGPVAATRVSSREIMISIACAIVGFVATAGVVHAVIRDPLHLHASIRSEKLAMMDQWRGKIFSAAFGSSHMHNGFDPRIFDATLAKSPVATRSANLAIEGGSQSEQFVMAQQFLRQLKSPAQAGTANQPCVIMLELKAGANFTNDHLVDARAINIYDWRTTRLVSRFVSPTMELTQRFGRRGFALLAMTMHYANVGMLSSKIFKPPLDESILLSQTADERRGQLIMPYHAAYLPALYGMAHRIPKQPVIPAGEMLDGNAELAQQLAAISPVSNVSFVYVVMPRLEDVGAEYPDHITIAGTGHIIEVPIINLGRANQNSALFDPELWYDGSHLNGVGARMATRALAEQLKQWYAVHGGPSPCG